MAMLNQRSSSLSDLAYEKILENIVEGKYAQDSRLPAEDALAKEFGVSRPVVREALARLRDDGLVVSRRGSGSFVVGRPAPVIRAFAPLSSISDMQRCFEFRVALESNAAHEAASHRLDADMERLRATLNRLDEVAANGTLGVEEDFDFHLAVCQASRNRFYVGMMQFLRENIVSGMTLTRNLSLRRTTDRLRRVQQEHHAVVDAIDRQDSSAAFDAMATHLDNARLRVFEGVDYEDGRETPFSSRKAVLASDS
jgi:GntR family transcriptional regulator, transcriptional repressor for pyruvate dehydrogenase complex